IDPEKLGSIQEKAVELKQGDIESVKIYSTKILTILEGCPMFKNKDLLEHFGSPTPKELIKKLLLAGEMDS
ncbi:XkdN-like protein, partial [Clostridioides difficile]|nr:XkdN-like protein [Clostridioides difficile]